MPTTHGPDATADGTKRERTVGDIMSHPVVTGRPAETLADAATRMRDRHVGSVVVVDADERAIGILTERDMIRIAAAGADASSAKVSEWMTADPDTVGPDIEARAAFATLSEHGYRHIPVVEDARLVGIVSMRDLMRIAMIQPAEAQAHEVPKGLEGVVVAETTVGDVRGLEGFYHYRQYSAIDLARSRPLEDVWQLLFDGALPETAAERDAFAGEVPVATRHPRNRARRASGDRARRRTVRAVGRAAHRDLAVRRGARLPVLDRRRRGDALRQRAVDLRGGADAHRGALAPRPRRASRSHRAMTSATPPTTCT